MMKARHVAAFKARKARGRRQLRDDAKSGLSDGGAVSAAEAEIVADRHNSIIAEADRLINYPAGEVDKSVDNGATESASEESD